MPNTQKELSNDELEKFTGGATNQEFIFSLSIVSHTCPLAAVINNIMSLAGVGHLQAKNMATNFPEIVTRDLTKREALEIRSALGKLGIQAEINPID